MHIFQAEIMAVLLMSFCRFLESSSLTLLATLLVVFVFSCFLNPAQLLLCFSIAAGVLGPMIRAT